jgi:c-di-GMP-binding flagellar brake protein YcgR
MGTLNRRNNYRISLQMFLNEYIADEPYRCMSLNLSPWGLYLNRLNQPEQDEHKKPSVIGLEFELPGTSETIWAKGEVRYDVRDDYFHGTGVEITGIAQAHQRLISEYVLEQRANKLRKVLANIRRNRLH